MESKLSNWFEVKVKSQQVQENGMEKNATETYVVDAETFSDAENTICKEMQDFIKGDFLVTAIKKAAYREILFSDEEKDDKWYKAKLQFITIDEKTGKEKRSNVNYLIQAANISIAMKNINEFMSATLIDYVTANLSETQILDVYKHE